MATPRPALCYTKELQILQKQKLGTSGLISLYWTISYDAWRWKTTKPEDSDAFSKVEHKHQTPVAVLIMHVITSLLYIFFNNLCRPIGKYIYLSEKALICMFSRSNAPKYSKFSVTNAGKKNSWLFLWHCKGVDFSPRNNFANFGSFAKVSVSVENTTPWLHVDDNNLIILNC